MRVLAFAFVAGLCCPAWGAHACSSTTTTPNTMAITSPCVNNIVSYNQVAGPMPTNAAVSDTVRITGSAVTPITVQAPGMLNVEVRTHNALAKRLTSDGVGGFSGTINTSAELEGPLMMEIDGWNTAPGGAYTIHLKATFDVWVHTNKWFVVKQPVGAAGMHQVFLDRFGTLSATACKPGTGTWPNCTKPTAADGYTYYENLPAGGDFGLAANEHTDGPFNPYNLGTTLCTEPCQAGFLRIRSQHSSTYVDPYGFSRHWYSGTLASAFPDGTTRLSSMKTGGYCEIRAKIPKGSSVNNETEGGGTWPAFWMLHGPAIKAPANNIEVDVGEWYGINDTIWHDAEHPYGTATGPNGDTFGGSPTVPKGVSLAWEFNRYGVKFVPGTVTAYFNDTVVAVKALDKFADGSPYDPYLIIDLAMGGGFHTFVPPATYYDFWVDYVQCWAL